MFPMVEVVGNEWKLTLGDGVDRTKFLTKLKEKYKVGARINLKGYTSSTLKRNAAVGFAFNGIKDD